MQCKAEDNLSYRTNVWGVDITTSTIIIWIWSEKGFELRTSNMQEVFSVKTGETLPEQYSMGRLHTSTPINQTIYLNLTIFSVLIEAIGRKCLVWRRAEPFPEQYSMGRLHTSTPINQTIYLNLTLFSVLNLEIGRVHPGETLPEQYSLGRLHTSTPINQTICLSVAPIYCLEFWARCGLKTNWLITKRRAKYKSLS